MRGGIVYLMAKEPLPGLVKTRLCPPLDAKQAACLAEAFASDTLSMLAGLEGCEPRLALADEGRADGVLRGLARGLGIAVEDQGDGDLGARMARLMTRGLAGGRPTLLVGGDAPDLPRATVESAFEGLGRVDVVLVPARDGGYVLVGARREVDNLFRIDAPWSSARVFDATREALSRSGWSYDALAPWEDVDDAAALGRLSSRLDAGVAPATARLLECWRREGVRF